MHDVKLAVDMGQTAFRLNEDEAVHPHVFAGFLAGVDRNRRWRGNSRIPSSYGADLDNRDRSDE